MQLIVHHRLYPGWVGLTCSNSQSLAHKIILGGWGSCAHRLMIIMVGGKLRHIIVGVVMSVMYAYAMQLPPPSPPSMSCLSLPLPSPFLSPLLLSTSLPAPRRSGVCRGECQAKVLCQTTCPEA